MELYIDGKKIDFNLEKEKTLGDIMQNLIRILDAQDSYITSFTCDGKEYQTDSFTEIVSVPLDTIEKMDVKTGFKYELTANSVESLIEYLTNVVNHLRNEETIAEADIAKIKDGIVWSLTVVEKIMVLYSLSSDFFITKSGRQLSFVINEIRKLTDNLQHLVSNPTFRTELLNWIIDFMDGVVKVVTYVFVKLPQIPVERKKEHIVTLLTDNLTMMDRVITLLPEIAGKFQTGHERDALDTFPHLVSYLSFYIDVLIRSIESFSGTEYDFAPLKENIHEITVHLTSIRDDLEKQDYVNLADSLEYELVEPLKSLRSGSEAFKNFLAGADKKP